MRDLPAERAAAKLTQAQFRTWLTEHPVAAERPAIAAWLEEAARQGQVHAGMRPVIERALRIVAALPSAAPIQRTVLAARLLDANPHGLDVDTPLHRLTVSLLAAAAGLDRDTPARAIWSAWNVLVDPISSNVAVLNLPLSVNVDAGKLPRWIPGTHVILTYGQLSASQLQWPPGAVCFSCENPSVLIAAELGLGRDCPPLICTGGHPSDAVRRLFSAFPAPGRSAITATTTARECRSSATFRPATGRGRGGLTLMLCSKLSGKPQRWPGSSRTGFGGYRAPSPRRW